MSKFSFKVGQRVNYAGELVTIESRSRVKTVEGFTLPDGGPFYQIQGGPIVRQAELQAVETLPVIFRAERSGECKGDVTAVFPTLPHDTAGRYFTVYAHIGQHGSGDFGWYHSTRAARPDEYADLLRELTRIYGSSIHPSDPVIALKVYKRMTRGHMEAFNAEARRIRGMS